MKRILTFCLFAFCFSARGATIPESPPSSWNPGSFGFSSTTEYFTSTANYDTVRGSFNRLPSGNSFTTFETRAKARYAFAHAVSAYGGLGFAQSKASDTSVDKTNSNVTDFFVGANFQLVRRWWRVVPDFEMSLPLDAAKRFQTVPLTSEGVWSTRAGVFLFKPFKHLRFESYLGFLYLGEGLSKRFLYSLLAESAFGGFTFGGGISGYESVLADEKTENERTGTQALADAGSGRYWAYNPALLEARGWLGFRADKAFTVRLGYAKTLNGVRTAEGSSILLSVAYNSPGDKSKGRAIREGLPVDRRGPEDSFQAEPETTDPELFDQKNDPLVPKKNESLDDTEKILEKRN
ncbi:MAG: hypothetical protein V4760_15200 [Bdellovibrionota bacterium]